LEPSVLESIALSNLQSEMLSGGVVGSGSGRPVDHRDMLRRSARCAECGGKGATIQIPGWGALLGPPWHTLSQRATRGIERASRGGRRPF